MHNMWNIHFTESVRIRDKSEFVNILSISIQIHVCEVAPRKTELPFQQQRGDLGSRHSDRYLMRGGANEFVHDEWCDVQVWGCDVLEKYSPRVTRR